MAFNFGLPYMGSKNFIAREIVEQLPPAEYFVDLFCGGCAITHAAIVSGKYKRFIINDVNDMIPQMFLDAIEGKYRYEKRVIDRETFHRECDKDPYVKLCWSFGNAGDTYLWGRDREGMLLAAHRMIMADTWQERRRHYQTFVDELRKFSAQKALKREIEYLDPLPRLERIQALEQLGWMRDKITRFNSDYRDIAIPRDAVVYCDPPYESSRQIVNTRPRNKRYFNGFNFAVFREWVRTREFPVYVSEYAMPDDFVSVWSREKRVTMANTVNDARRIEHLFLHKRFVEQPAEQQRLQLGEEMRNDGDAGDRQAVV